MVLLRERRLLVRRELLGLLLPLLVSALGVLEPDEHADDDHEDEDAENAPEPVDLVALTAASATAAAPGQVRIRGGRPDCSIGPHLRFQTGQYVDELHQRFPPRQARSSRPVPTEHRC
ncbi:hypothetical protein [Nocardia cyriacigeorgica]|uniref:Uncharacterized protein n=1 Tax=Nocardia cyriacigeorgica TaxID=135487 RepID=A0A5R8NJN5_9NOCA|nr:hypothetical protein [Nocardia cyriacigeorgica]TLF75764.1 hypothetical protein FEK34_18450 [Nocardia cyriacigeorgica]